MDIIGLRICRELGIKPIISVKDFDDLDHEKLFVGECALLGRNLNDFQRTELALKLKPTLQAIAKRNESLGGKGVKSFTPLKRVNEKIGNHAQVSHITVRKVENILREASPTLIDKARLGQKTIHKVFRLTQKDQRRKQIEEEARNYNDIQGQRQANNYELFNDDFRNVKLTANSIDLIFTDPPYPKIWFPNYSDLAKLAAETLVSGGSLVTYCNQSQIPQIIQVIVNAGLCYCHIIAVILDNKATEFPRDYQRGITYKYKPLLWFVKGTREENPELLSDVIYSKKPEKHKHPWEQSPIEPAHVIPRLTKANGKSIVLDPMMGSGVTGIVALGLKRRFIGIDKNPMTFQIAKANIGKFVSSGSDLASIIDPIGETERRD